MNKKVAIALSIVVLLLGGTYLAMYYISDSKCSAWEATMSQLEAETNAQNRNLQTAIRSGSLSSKEAGDMTVAMNNLIARHRNLSQEMAQSSLPSHIHSNRSMLLVDAVSKGEQKLSNLHKAVRVALSDTKGDIDALRYLKADCDRHRSNYQASLSTHSDVADFEKMAAAVEVMQAVLSAKKTELDTLLAAIPASDLKDTLKVLLLRSESGFIDETHALLQTQLSNVLILREALEAYKRAIRSDLCNNQILLRNISTVTDTYLPLIRSVNMRIEPLNSVLRDLNRPIQGTEALGALNIAGVGVGGSITPLSLIRSIDPATGTIISHISTFCQGLAVLESEFRQASEATGNYSLALASARSNASRDEMLTLVNKSRELQGFLESKRGILQPFVRELDKVGNEITRIDHLVRRVQVPQARAYLMSFTSGSRQILNLAYTPFNRWETLMNNLNQPLTAVQQKEEAYLSLLSHASSGTLEGSELAQRFIALTHSRIQYASVPSGAGSRGTAFHGGTGSLASGSASIVAEYTARLSHKDHYNSSGAFLNHAPAIIQQDRANFHRFNNPDPEDQADPFFTTLERRSLITNNPNAMKIPAHVADRIVRGTPLVRVRKYDNGRIDVELLD